MLLPRSIEFLATVAVIARDPPAGSKLYVNIPAVAREATSRPQPISFEGLQIATVPTLAEQTAA